MQPSLTREQTEIFENSQSDLNGILRRLYSKQFSKYDKPNNRLELCCDEKTNRRLMKTILFYWNNTEKSKNHETNDINFRTICFAINVYATSMLYDYVDTRKIPIDKYAKLGYLDTEFYNSILMECMNGNGQIGDLRKYLLGKFDTAKRPTPKIQSNTIRSKSSRKTKSLNGSTKKNKSKTKSKNNSI
jgi:hypothetical protein